MRAGGRHGAQEELSRASLMAEPPLWCEGLSPQNSPSACAPRGEPGGEAGPPVPWLPLLAPLCACSDQAGTLRAAEPVRTALLGELVQVMTAEADPAAAELKDFFLLIFLQPA